MEGHTNIFWFLQVPFEFKGLLLGQHRYKNAELQVRWHIGMSSLLDAAGKVQIQARAIYFDSCLIFLFYVDVGCEMIKKEWWGRRVRRIKD